MRQWDIYLYSFQQEQPHPVVILSNDEICANLTSSMSTGCCAHPHEPIGPSSGVRLFSTKPTAWTGRRLCVAISSMP